MMDQTDISMQPNASSGYEYTPNVTEFNPNAYVSTDNRNEYTPNVSSYNPQVANYQYTGDVMPTYTNNETIIESSVTTECNVMPTNYEYMPNYLAPANFYGNPSYGSTQYQKMDDENYTYGQYDQHITTENAYSNMNNVPEYKKSVQGMVEECKPMIVSEVCVEEAKIEVKTEDSQPMDESQGFAQQEVVVEHTTVTVNHEEESQQEVKEKAQDNEVTQESREIIHTKTSENVQNSEITKNGDENTNQSNTNDIKPVIQNIQMCIRSGCVNEAINNPEWEQEFCSNECVILHCKNVFDSWVKSNPVNAS